MLFKQLALAATAAAILVVPETSEADDNIFRALPIDVDTFEVPPTAFSQSIDVPCAKCHGHDTQLKMNFAIEEHKLMLNGFELYPNADPWHGDLWASVSNKRKTKNLKLGYGLSVKPEGMDEEQHLEVVAVELRVIEVGRHFVNDIPPIKVKLVKAPNNELIIGNIEIIDPSEAEDCTSIWCRAKDKLSGAWKDFKGSFKSCDGTKQTWDFKHSDNDGHRGHKGRPSHPHGHHGGYTHENNRAKWYHQAVLFVSWAVFAVIMGVAAGAGVAAITVFLVTCIAGFLRAVRSESLEEISPGAAHKADIVEIVVHEDEKSGLMEEEEHEDAPPKYDEAQV